MRRRLSIIAKRVLIFKVFGFAWGAACLMVWMACLRLTRISGERAWRCGAEIDYGKAHHKHPRAFFESLVKLPRIPVETDF